MSIWSIYGSGGYDSHQETKGMKMLNKRALIVGILLYVGGLVALVAV